MDEAITAVAFRATGDKKRAIFPFRTAMGTRATAAATGTPLDKVSTVFNPKNNKHHHSPAVLTDAEASTKNM